MLAANDREADLTIGPVAIWALGRPYPDAENGWDEAFIEIYSLTSVPDAWVEIGRGEGLVSMSLDGFCRGLVSLDRTLSGTAVLQADWLNLTLTGDGIGHCSGVAEIRKAYPGHEHRFEFSLDQTEVRVVLRQCRAMLDEYPVPTQYART
jgi:hypothetical protein